VVARFYQLVVDANDPSRLAHWWAEVLGYDVLYETPDEVIIGTDPAQYPGICFISGSDAKVTKNRLHIDLDPDDHEEEVARVTELGARHADIGQGDVPWTVLADPEHPHTAQIPHRIALTRARRPSPGSALAGQRISCRRRCHVLGSRCLHMR
jgi:hypothetical protein